MDRNGRAASTTVEGILRDASDEVLRLVRQVFSASVFASLIFSSIGFAQDRAAIHPGIHAAVASAMPAVISGTVTDTTGAIVPGAHVALTTATGAMVTSTTTDTPKKWIRVPRLEFRLRRSTC